MGSSPVGWAHSIGGVRVVASAGGAQGSAGNQGCGPRHRVGAFPIAWRCFGTGEEGAADRTPDFPRSRLAVVNARRVATTRRPRRAMPFRDVDLGLGIKEMVLGMPVWEAVACCAGTGAADTGRGCLPATAGAACAAPASGLECARAGAYRAPCTLC